MFLAGLFIVAGQQDATAVGLSSLIVAMMLGAIIFGLPGGAVVDRLGPARALAVGAVGRAGVIAAAFALSGSPELAAILAFAYSAISQVYTPAELALVSGVAPQRPAGAHSARVTLQHAGQGTGMVLLAPAAYFLAGAPAMIATGLVLYVLVTGMAFAIAISRTPARRLPVDRRPWNFTGTVRYLWREPHALYAGSLLAYSEMAAKAMLVAIPLYLAEDLRLSSIWTLVIIVPAIAGGLAGLGWAARGLHVRLAPQVMRLTLLGTIASAVALAGLGEGLAAFTGIAGIDWLGGLRDPASLSIIVAIPVALLLGICFVVAPVGSRTVLSATAPGGEQGRVFATQATLTDLVAIIPLLAAGIGTEIAGARTTFLFIGVLGAALFVLLELQRVRRGGDQRLEAAMETREAV